MYSHPYPDDEEDLVKSTLLDYSTRASEIEMSSMDEMVWMGDYRKCCHLLSEV